MKNGLFLLVSVLSLLLSAGESQFYGVCTHVSRKGVDFEQMDALFRAMKGAGIRWARTDFDWWAVEPGRGRWDFSHLDLLRDKARQEGIRILPILGYSGVETSGGMAHVCPENGGAISERFPVLGNLQ